MRDLAGYAVAVKHTRPSGNCLHNWQNEDIQNNASEVGVSLRIWRTRIKLGACHAHLTQKAARVKRLIRRALHSKDLIVSDGGKVKRT